MGSLHTNHIFFYIVVRGRMIKYINIHAIIRMFRSNWVCMQHTPLLVGVLIKVNGTQRVRAWVGMGAVEKNDKNIQTNGIMLHIGCWRFKVDINQ